METNYTVFQTPIKSIFSNISGSKILILDLETTGILSVLITQTELLELAVISVLNISDVTNTGKEQLDNTTKFLPAICILRPTKESFKLLEKLLQLQLFFSYYIYFTSPLTERQIDKIAQFDTLQRIRHLSSITCDFLLLSPQLFSLELQSCHGLLFPTHINHSTYESYCFERILSGLVSALCTFCNSSFAGICYSKNSQLCHIFANNIVAYLHTYGKTLKPSIFEVDTSGKKESSVLCIIDRREDVITPLILPWTYEAMIHEFFTIDRNVVNIKPSSHSREQKKIESIILNSNSDNFFKENRYTLFGALSDVINEKVSEVQQIRNEMLKWNQDSTDNIQNLKNIIHFFPEKQQYNTLIAKHVQLIHELSDYVQKKNLIQIGRMQQEIISSPSLKNSIYEEIVQLFNDKENKLANKSISNELVILCILYILQYRKDFNKTNYLMTLLQSSGVDTFIVHQLLSYIGPNFDTHNEFSTFDVAKDVVSRNLQSNKSNIFLSHKSLLVNLVDVLTKKGTKYIQKHNFDFMFYKESNKSYNYAPKNIIIFIIGGATYKEIYDLHQFQTDSTSIVLGGTTIHNSISFLSEIALVNSDSIFSPSSSEFERKPAVLSKVTEESSTKLKKSFIDSSW